MTVRHVLVVDWCGRPYLKNAAQRDHWRTIRARTGVWRQAGIQAARIAQLPAMRSASFTVEAIYRRGPLPDGSSVSPSFEAFLDGLVEAGVLPDDSAGFVTGTTFLPARKIAPTDTDIKGAAALVVTIEGDPK